MVADAPLRIVFLGTPAFAVPTLDALLESRHQICGVVTQPDRRRGRGQRVQDAPVKARALERQLPLIQPERIKAPEAEDAIRTWTPDLGVVVAYGQIIPQRLLDVPRLGMINVHASLLPKYRGAAPVHRAVIDGEHVTGVTIMRVVAQLDAGNMLAKVTRPIGAADTSEAVERDLSRLGAGLLVDVVNRIAAGAIDEERQDDMLATYAPRLSKEEGLIDWSLPSSFIHNRVRGLYPWPHAYTYLGSERLILLTTEELTGRPGGEPGTVMAVTRDAIEVATGHGGRIAIRAVQPEGRRPMPVRDYLTGHPIAIASRFTGP
jgi:methionyl-tRNA formyltransferase